MKLVNLFVSSLVLTSSYVVAFKNALPLFIQLNGDSNDELTYVTKENTLPICSILSTKKNIVLQIPNLSNQDFFHGLKQVPQIAELVKSEFFKFTPFYKYNKNSKNDLKCGDKQLHETEIADFDDEEWITELDNLSDETDEVLVFKFPSLSNNLEIRYQELIKIDKYVNVIVSLIKDNENYKIIVQGLPFKSGGNFDIMESLDSLIRPKREEESSSTTDYDKLKQDVDDAFKEIENMLENEGDGLVTISSNSTNEGGLFEHYQFFTPGIWMSTVVSFFLISILIILYQWLSSLQISYKSFEKQVDFQKKTQ